MTEATEPAKPSLWVRADEKVHKLARTLAYRLPWQLLAIAIAFFGSFLIWLSPKPAAMVTVLFNFVDCHSQFLGKWLDLSCAKAPNILGEEWWWPVLGFCLWVGAFLILWGSIWLVARIFVSLSSRIFYSDLVRQNTIPHKVLIMGLSVVADPAKAKAEAERWKDDVATYAGPAEAWKAKVGAAARADAAGWQQAARMVAAHRAGGILKTIYLLPSHETIGLVDDFKIYLKTLFGQELDIRLVTGEDNKPFEDIKESGWRRQSYENYIYLRDGLLRAITIAKQQAKEQRLGESDICIDATAGFKLFSIAAAVVSFDRNILLGYVVSGGGPSANPEEGTVKIYDARIEFSAAVRNRVRQYAMPSD